MKNPKKASNSVQAISKATGHSLLANTNGPAVQSNRSTEPRCAGEGLGTCCIWTTEPQYLGNQITTAVKSSQWFWLCQQCPPPFAAWAHTCTHRLGRTHTHTHIKTPYTPYSEPVPRLCFIWLSGNASVRHNLKAAFTLHGNRTTNKPSFHLHIMTPG